MHEEKSKKIDLKLYDGEDKVLTSHELDLLLDAQPQAKTIKSRIASMDRYIEGFQGGELITISGPTKGGKTLLAQTLTNNFARQQEYPLWFTFEVPSRQFLSQFPKLPMFYLPAKLKAHAMPWIHERIMESFAKYHSRIIFIDHLHFLFDMAQARNTSLQIGTVIRQLKKIAVDNEFIIFLLCHTHKNKGEEINYESIRDSSFVAQESDSVFIIYRTPDIGENMALLSIEFHRRTGVLEKKIILKKENGLLYEPQIEEYERKH